MKTKKLNNKAKNSKSRRWEPTLASLLSEYLSAFVVTFTTGKVMIERVKSKKRSV